jgi:hypothetical protein
MNHIAKFSVVGCGLLLVAKLALAESLAEKKRWQELMSKIQGSVESAKESCGLSALEFEYDKASFATMPGTDAGGWTITPEYVCREFPQFLNGFCDDEQNKAALAVKKVTKLTCAYAPKGGSKVVISEGAISVATNNDDDLVALLNEEFGKQL